MLVYTESTKYTANIPRQRVLYFTVNMSMYTKHAEKSNWACKLTVVPAQSLRYLPPRISLQHLSRLNYSFTRNCSKDAVYAISVRATFERCDVDKVYARANVRLLRVEARIIRP
jgi:hypothetical protein